MATLMGTGFDSETVKPIEIRFSIDPVPPSPEGPHDAYDVDFGPDWQGRNIRFRGDVRGWHFGHSSIDALAHMFQSAHLLHDPHWRYGRCAGMGLLGDVDWLQIVLRSAKTRTNPGGIHIRAYVADSSYSGTDKPSRERHSQDYRLIPLALTADVAAVELFGADLEREVREARMARQLLGLLTEEDEDALIEDEGLVNRSGN